ncbi:hypothetical protein [Streptomyces sp. NPDC089799]|uniref:hypothetical protein n=1 Tax=Streptomyces sp. NPDC089799 TaxID=3155066 RepID=UPI00342B15A1
MKRTRIAALVLVGSAAALAPALASAADQVSYLQDPAGDGKAMKKLWTKGKEHKVEGQARFHPGVVYTMTERKGNKNEHQGDWGSQVPDPESLAWEPKFEFAWAVSDAKLVKGAVTTQGGKHPVVLHGVLRRADGSKAAEVHSSVAGRPAKGKATLPGGKRIACDTGEYTVEWSITRTHYGTLGGTMKWNADCTNHRTAFRQANTG